jgi:hypothetical protein
LGSDFIASISLMLVLATARLSAQRCSLLANAETLAGLLVVLALTVGAHPPQHGAGLEHGHVAAVPADAGPPLAQRMP